MASSPIQPSTPGDTPRRTTISRSFTVPAKISSTPNKPVNASAEIGATEGVETLFVHPSASIIKFTSSSRPGSTSSAGASQGRQPWTSPTERPMASGPMEIYRVPGSVSFLHSGALLHAILPRSNCWCVDGVSKFALRVLPDTYYRIELPGSTEEDLQEVEKLKVTLQKVLFYERTPCPFARTFDVDLPAEPEVRKKRRKSSGPAKKWKLQHGSSWRPDGWEPPEEGGEESGSGSEDEDDGSEDGGKEDSAELADEVKDISVTTPTRPSVSNGLRSVTAPMPASLQSPTPSRLRTRVDADGTVEASERIGTDSTQPETPRTRTLQAIPTYMPPSPPDSSAGLDYGESQGLAGGGAVEDRSREADVPANEDANVDTLHPREQDLEVSAQSEPVPQTETTEDEPTDVEATEATAFATTEPEEDRILPSSEQQVDKHATATEEPVSSEAEANTAVTEEPATRQDSIDGNEFASADGETETAVTEQPTTLEDSNDDRPVTPAAQTSPDDPYAAIQARILARRSIGGTTTFYPGRKSPTRGSSSSTSSTATIASTVSRRSQSSQHQQAFATAMVKKACSVFLGPPARLVAIMLQIAARYADAAFGVNSMFYVESPNDSSRDVPGSYHLASDDLEDLDSEWEEDDFGVPLRSPVRMAGLSGGVDGLRERRGWDID